MIVKLAGFNVDIENIKFLNGIIKKFPALSPDEIEYLKKIHWTPETISASYARISRDPRSIGELRDEARIEIEKTRKSNNSIIYEMGHSSIAEHGVFNIDIIGISRLISEELEKSRLVSFTEKSQRYIKIGEDVFYPEEFKKDNAFFERYKALVTELFDTYNYFLGKLEPYFTEKYPVENKKSAKYRDVVNLAKEDARYILPLSTLTQLGMTLNSRNLEKIIQKLSAIGIEEAGDLSRSIYEEIKKYAPSLIKYTDPTEFLKKAYNEIKNLINEIGSGMSSKDNESFDVMLAGFDPDFENKILAGFLLKTTSLDYRSAYDTVKKMPDKDKKRIFNCSLKYLKSFESLPREFELSNFEFNIKITATAFAQLKRHRMMTLIDGNYSPQLGIIIPPSIIDIGLKEMFTTKIDKINKLYHEARQKFGRVSGYILSNSHRKNILVKCNFRELAHITKLRSDTHAQWDIRNISEKMTALVREKFPYMAHLLCGKDDFDEKIKHFFC